MTKKTGLGDHSNLVTSTVVSSLPNQKTNIMENPCRNSHNLQPATNHMTDLSINLNFLQHNENLKFKIEKCNDCNILKAKKTTLSGHEPNTSKSTSSEVRDKNRMTTSFETPTKEQRTSLKRNLAQRDQVTKVSSNSMLAGLINLKLNNFIKLLKLN